MPTPKDKVIKIGGQKDVKFFTKFAKVDAEQRMVSGYCTSESVDSQGEIVSKEAIRKAWAGYMEYGNIREMHQPSAVGVTKNYGHDENGTWIDVKVIDGSAWEKVKEGVYKGFSIGGRVVKQTDNVIEELILSEISLVDRPANPDAKIMVYKVDEGLVDTSALEAVTKLNILMNKFVEIDGVKYVEDPANAGQPLLDDAGEKTLYVEPTDEVEQTEEEKAAAVADAAAAEAAAKAEEDAKAEADAKAAADAEAEAAEAQAKADAEAGDANANANADADAAASEADKGDKATSIKKDTDGVLTMANVLMDIEWAISCFASDGKDTTALETVKTQVMSVIESEAAAKEAGDKGGDLSKMNQSSLEKMLGSAFEKMFAPVKSQLDGLAADVALIKGTKVSPRPAASAAVDKVFVNKSGEQNSVDEAKAKVDGIRKEIDEFSDTMKSVLANEPHRSAEMTKKSSELLDRYEVAKRELNDAIAGL